MPTIKRLSFIGSNIRSRLRKPTACRAAAAFRRQGGLVEVETDAGVLALARRSATRW